MIDAINMVRDFHKKFGLPLGDKIAFRQATLRSKLIKEEAEETCDAVEEGDMVEVADGLCDILYVVFGCAISFGIDLLPLFAEVHRTNMAKDGGATRPDGKILKPEGWQPPRIKELLAEQGYNTPFIQKGFYKHFKGALYNVKGIARDVRNGAEPDALMVYYEDFPDVLGKKPEAYVRPAKEFIENVTWPNGTIGPRFLFVRH